jgi:hypothetical protein
MHMHQGQGKEKNNVQNKFLLGNIGGKKKKQSHFPLIQRLAGWSSPVIPGVEKNDKDTETDQR